MFFRYSINYGDVGGLVVAADKDEARNKVYARYDGTYVDVNDDVLQVWDIKRDEYYDAEFPDVLECYGI